MSFWDYEYFNEIWEKGLADPLPEQRNEMELHPSMVGCRDARGKGFGGCSRKAWYQRKYPEEGGLDVVGSMIVNEGNHFEAHANQVFMAAGVAIRPNPMNGQPRIMIKRTTEKGTVYFIVGRLDMIYRNPKGDRALVDFKRPVTDSSADAVMGTSKWDNSGPKAKDQNIIQMAIYANWARQHGISDCKLAYGMPGRRKGRVFDITVEANGDIFVKPQDGPAEKQAFTIHDIYREFDYLADCIAEDKVPDRPFELFYSPEELDRIAMKKDLPKTWRDKLKMYGKVVKNYGDSPCSYCDFISVCHGVEDAQLALKMQGR